MNPQPTGRMTLKLAIVGGGRACKFFLKLGNLPYLQIDIIGVCDINPEAEGFRMAQQLGIYTTTDFRDLFVLKALDGIIELTNNRDVLVELIQLRPPPRRDCRAQYRPPAQKPVYGRSKTAVRRTADRF